MRPTDIKNAANSVWHATRKIDWYGENPIKFERYPLNIKSNPAFLKFKYPDDEGPLNYLIAVEHPLGFEYGTELLHFNIHDHYIVGKDMYVSERYQDSGYRIGEILRLSSIMMLIKNNFNFIKLYATNPAVLFQAKYKFEPNIAMPGERLEALASVIKNKKEPNMEEIKRLAIETYKEAKSIAYNDRNTPRSLELYETTNKLLADFMKQMFKNGRRITPSRQPFDMGMSMILTKDRIIENKEFYNKLYRKHNIDFQI